jgi:hypothetical protein
MMREQPEHFGAYCEKKAREGDGSFAIAHAILQLVDEMRMIGETLDQGLTGRIPGALQDIAEAGGPKDRKQLAKLVR